MRPFARTSSATCSPWQRTQGEPDKQKQQESHFNQRHQTARSLRFSHHLSNSPTPRIPLCIPPCIREAERGKHTTTTDTATTPQSGHCFQSLSLSDCLSLVYVVYVSNIHHHHCILVSLSSSCIILHSYSERPLAGQATTAIHTPVNCTLTQAELLASAIEA